MALWDILKKKKPSLEEKKAQKTKVKKEKIEKTKVEKAKVKKEKKEKTVKDVKAIKKPQKETLQASPKKKKVEKDFAFRVLKSPHLTEKATILTEKNQYTFEVYPGVNKTEIKRAVEQLYDVDVLSVNIAKKPRKRRRLRKVLGWRKGYKKAIVKIKEGQKIEGLI